MDSGTRGIEHAGSGVYMDSDTHGIDRGTREHAWTVVCAGRSQHAGKSMDSDNTARSQHAGACMDIGTHG